MSANGQILNRRSPILSLREKETVWGKITLRDLARIQTFLFYVAFVLRCNTVSQTDI